MGAARGGAEVDAPWAACRLDLFAVPVWTTRLDMSPDDRARVIADITDRLHRFRAPGVAGQHTGSVFQDRGDPWWTSYHRALLTVSDALVGDLGEEWSERFVRTWAVRYETVDDYRLGQTHLHSHMGKTFSFVFSLQLDPASVDDIGASTLLRNPQANLAAITGSAVEWHGPTRPMTGIAFPGAIEHQAAVPENIESWSSARIVLVTDVAYY